MYHFSRYLRIRYDTQPKNNPIIPDNNKPKTEDTLVPTNHPTPQITNNEKEIPPRNLAYIQQKTPNYQKPRNLMNLLQIFNSD